MGINTNTISSTDTSVSSAYYALQIRYAPGSPGLLGDSLRHRCHPKPGAPCQQPGRNCRLPAGGWFGRDENPTGLGLCSSSLEQWWQPGVVAAVLVVASRRSKSSPTPTQTKGMEEAPSPALSLARFRGLRRRATAASASKGFPARWRASGSSCLPAAR